MIQGGLSPGSFFQKFFNKPGTQLLLALLLVFVLDLKRYVFAKAGLEENLPTVNQFGGDKNKDLLNELIVAPYLWGSKTLIRLKAPGYFLRSFFSSFSVRGGLPSRSRISNGFNCC